MPRARAIAQQLLQLNFKRHQTRMNQESTAFAVGCCDLEWTKDAGSPSRAESLQADQVRCS